MVESAGERRFKVIPLEHERWRISATDALELLSARELQEVVTCHIRGCKCTGESEAMECMAQGGHPIINALVEAAREHERVEGGIGDIDSEKLLAIRNALVVSGSDKIVVEVK